MSVSSVGSSSSSTMQTLLSALKQTDADQSGGTSVSEMLSSFGVDASSAEGQEVTKEFTSMDSDGDGQLTATEFQTAFEQMAPPTQSGLLDVQEMFSSADTDGSGDLSVDEFVSSAPGGDDTANAERLQELFSQIDSDGDGAVSEDEFTSFQETMQAGGVAGGDTSSESSDTGSTGATSESSSSGSSSNSSSTTQITTNSDGSITITTTYADGSETTKTIDAPSGGNDASMPDDRQDRGQGDPSRQMMGNAAYGSQQGASGSAAALISGLLDLAA